MYNHGVYAKTTLKYVHLSFQYEETNAKYYVKALRKYITNNEGNKNSNNTFDLILA